VLELKHQGYTTEDIAEETVFHVRKIQRLIKRVSDSWFLRGGSRP
jgi:hypothetical protein